MGIFKKVAGKVVDVRVDKWMSLDYLGETTNRFKFLIINYIFIAHVIYPRFFDFASIS